MKGILVKYMRNLSGLTQTDLAEALGVHQSYISKVEKDILPVTIETEIEMMKLFEEKGIDTQIAYMINNLINSQK